MQIKLSNTLYKIGDGAFYNCVNLKSIKFPDTMRDCGENVFYNCPNFDTLTIIGNKNMTSIIPSYVFQKIKYLYVDNNLIQEYETFKTNNNLTFNIKHLLV